MAQDRPTAAELVSAVRDFLVRDLQPTLEGRLGFHTRISANALGMIERELLLGPALDAEERARAVAILGHDADLGVLEREIASGIRDGSLSASASEVRAHVRATVRGKLEIANPGYLDADDRA